MKRLICTLFTLFAMGAAHAATGTDPFGVSQALGLTAAQQTVAAPPPTAPASPTTVPSPAPLAAGQAVVSPAATYFDYSVNLKSDVFGAQLFTGAFAREGAGRFNPDYLIATGDQIQVRLWGAFDYDSLLWVDPKGNVFLPHVGPVKVLGVRNEDLQHVVEAAVREVFRANVSSYASLAGAQPVRVFVSGFVNRPGLYDGTSMDGLLHYLDLAGGIDAERGSFLKVQVKRGNTVRAEVNLYDFLLNGVMPLVQLGDGDVIFVPPRGNSVMVSGLAANTKRFEFTGDSCTIAYLAKLAKPDATVTNVRVVRNTGTVTNTEYFALADAAKISLVNGDELEFTADKKPGTISVRVEGEHESAQEYVLPYGTRLGELVKKIRFSNRSDPNSIQLFRRSVKERQAELLKTSLVSLENAALTARSGTSDEATLRKEEAGLILQWIDRAKQVEPKGQVLISQSSNRDDLLLENGDILRVPTRDGLVFISGEVLFPNAVAYDDGLSLNDYIQKAGGYTQNADSARLIIAHRDGSFSDPSKTSSPTGFGWDEEIGGAMSDIRPGDQILVLPKIDVKSRQIAKDITQILYQIAISAKVVLGL
jgi:protein involved in polysaccharide export with SLBB domain